MRFEVGQKAGDYEFLEVVESSATGLTYRVRNTLVERQELLKVLPRDLQEDPERVERFLREAKIHARLQHPNIAAFYNATRVDNQLVITTELVEGTSLRQRIASGSLSLEQATKYFEQALSALSYAHDEGVVHRDITPGHLVITPGDIVKVTGFGLAKKLADPQLTQPGIVMGSMHYMSPEQVKGSSDLDRRSDIYSLGVVLYEAVTGKKPFDSKSNFEVFMAHVNEDPPAPSSVRAGIPPQVDRIILTAMAKQPANRFQTADEFRSSLAQLQRVLKHPVAQPSPAELPAADPQAAAPRPSETYEPSAGAQTEAGVQPAEQAAEPAEQAAAVDREASVTEDPATRQAVVLGRPDFEPRDIGPSNRGSAFGSGEPGARGGAPQAAGRPGLQHSGPTEPTDARHFEIERSPAAFTTEPTDDPARDEQVAEPPQQVPLLLRSSGESSGYRETPAVVSPRRGQSSSQQWLGDPTFAGWTTKDVLAVGALTFVIVAAVCFALLTFLNR